MIMVSRLSKILQGIGQWHQDGTPMVLAEEILGAAPGRLIALFRDNSMLDATDRPLAELAAQDFINVCLLWLALLSKRKP